MFVLYIVISFVTITIVKGERDTICDCQEVGILKEIVQQVLIEKRMESARLSRVEAKLRSCEKTKTIPNARLAKLEENMRDINVKFNETVTGTKGKHTGLHMDIGAVMKKTLMSEKHETRKIVTNMNEKIMEHRDIIETFKVTINNTIEKFIQYIDAKQIKRTNEINEFMDDIQNGTATFIRTVSNNISTFKNEIIMEVNERLDSIKEVNKSVQWISSDIITVNQSVVETGDMVDILGKIVKENKVRLVNGSNQYEGRLEVWHDGTWGTVCDDGFDVMSATVVCRMLDYEQTNALVFKSAYFGAGSLPIQLDDVRCTGSETILSQCQHKGWGKHNCGHNDDVGISCTPVRLVNGSNQYEGRLEVWHDGSWGTVCDDGFDTLSASVVCRMLHYQRSNIYVFGAAYFGAGSLPIYIDDINCKGTETSLSECPHLGRRKHNCDHNDDVSMSCAPVRLVNGSTQYEGRLEVWHDGSWGTVCDDGFDAQSASVVCRMLNYQQTNPLVFESAYFGAGTLQIHLDDVKCTGTETILSQCQHKGWGKHNCGHNDDVGISCAPVRLVNGSDQYEGRLEVWHEGSWGTVCDDEFDTQSATIVCKMLHYQMTNPIVFKSAYYGPGALPIYLDDVNCTGTETSLSQCRHNGWGTHNCDHDKDVGVSCTPVRLVNGSTQYEGRVEVWYNGTWGTVCDDGFDVLSAAVVCRMLHYPRTIPQVFGSAHFGAGTLPIHLDDVKCKGTETSLSLCPHPVWGKHNCGHTEDVGIFCTPVRLVNGSNQYEGRLEVWHDRSWGTVCDDEFDVLSTTVVCRMLNYQHTNPLLFGSLYYGSGTLPIHLNDVSCTGSEIRLSQCPHNVLGAHNCSHKEVVGMSCTPVRLVNGSNQYEGRLEVWHGGAWGTVCDDGFDAVSASVVCRMLHYEQTNHLVFGSAYFGTGTLPIHLDDVKCTGTEPILSQCQHKGWGKHDCEHNDDVGISCTPVRLVNGSNQYEGRLEVWHDGSWGTVCDDEFDTLTASVVCRMLHFQQSNPLVFESAYFGTGALPIFFDDLKCTGTETSLSQCRHNGLRTHDCDHSDDVGISCTPVRLVNGSHQYEGRLEVWHNGSWGTVCDDGFDVLSATVVCKMLHYPRTNPLVFEKAHFGAGTSPIHLDDVKCKGTETSLLQCTHPGWGKHNCGHSEDVGISCTPVRLVNGSNEYEGRLEVWHGRTWGTVCDDEFDTLSATVVCMMLNYQQTNPLVFGSAYFGAGTLPIHLDDVKCTGNETTLSQCQHNNWGAHDCYHNDDVGISCTPVRLVNGSNQYEGRLEVWHKGSWGTACDDKFDAMSATVVCGMLHYQQTNPFVFGSAYFGAGALPIHLDEVKCKGTETSLTQCQHKGWGKHGCDHNDDVGISCTPVRLVNGSNQYEGRLEVWHDGAWGTVCDDGFDVLSATVVCRMLNYPQTKPLVFGSAHFGAGQLSIHLDDVKCTGNETTLSQCHHNEWGTHACYHKNDVGISCTPVRLVNGSNQYEGRLEVWYNGNWGTVCDDGFGALSASVVCKMLHYPGTNPLVFEKAHFGAGLLPIYLDDVRCTGTETILSQCSHIGWGNHNCAHSEDVGILCK